MTTSTKAGTPATLLLRIESLRHRAQLLTSLRPMVGLQNHQDLQREQWAVLENQLAAVSNRILQQLRLYTDELFSEYRKVSNQIARSWAARKNGRKRNKDSR